MKAAKTAERNPPPSDLLTKYRPLGLKAVLAAALQVKAKPAGKKVVKRPVEGDHLGVGPTRRHKST
ncbi:hypothetical protein [Ensifer aridi]|uniref:hypothetical protein n=1 Tax=Ensifer aridi TaxID=1708715 RepID=UPI000A10ECC0|nr:hypothetical protein [Ensifer aridi]